jgi:hypothetical protein
MIIDSLKKVLQKLPKRPSLKYNWLMCNVRHNSGEPNDINTYTAEITYLSTHASWRNGGP